MKTKTSKRIMALFLAVLLFLSSSVTQTNLYAVQAADKKSQVVTTQKELEKALKKNSLKKLVIQGSKSTQLTIPKGEYPNVDLVVKAPKSDVTNYGTFRSIAIVAMKNGTYMEAANRNNIRLISSKASVKVQDGCTIQKLTITKKSVSAFILGGDIERLNVNARSTLKIKGSSGHASVYINKGGRNSTIETDLPITIRMLADAGIVLNEGGGESRIIISKNNVSYSIKNNTERELSLDTLSGKKTLSVGKIYTGKTSNKAPDSGIEISGGGSSGGGSSGGGNSSGGTVTDTDIPGYTRGEWLSLLSQKLGFLLGSDIHEDLYYFSDTYGKAYGEMAEIAQAYGLLPECDAAGYEDPAQDVPVFEADKKVTREYAAYTVVKALGYMEDGVETLECGDQSGLKYGAVDAIAVRQGIIGLKNNLFLPDEVLDKNTGTAMLAKIDEINNTTNINADEAVDSMVYQDQVLTGVMADGGDYTVEEANGTYVVKISDMKEAAMEAGTVFVLPANETYPSGIALKAVSVERAPEGSGYVIQCTKPELEEVIESIDYAGICVANAENIEVSDGVTCRILENDSQGGMNRSAVGVNVNESIPIPKKYELTTDKKIGQVEIKGKLEVSIPEVACRIKTHTSWGKVKFDEFLLAITEQVEATGNVTWKIAESGYETVDESGNKQFEGGKVEIGRIPVPINGLLSADIIVYIELLAKGTVDIKYVVNARQGFQYINEQPRVIKDFSQSLETLQIKGSFQIGMGLGGMLSALEIIDLAGLNISAGLAGEASFEPHLDAEPPLYCGDGNMHLYSSMEIPDDNALGKFLGLINVRHSWDIFDKNNSPFKTSFHIENMRKVDACTYGKGSLEGTVMDTNGNKIAGAKVELSKNNSVLKNTFSGSQGEFGIENLSPGRYKLQVKATGSSAYEVEVEIKKGQRTYVETCIMIYRNDSGGDGIIKGSVINAVTGEKISDVSYFIRKNWNHTTGEILYEGQVSGDYELTIPSGNYTIQFEADGFIECSVNVAVISGDTVSKTVALSPVLNVEDDLIRIILTWGQYPYDLDSHLVGYAPDKFHIYYSNKRYSNGNGKVADLDLDDRNSYGPETVTLYNTNGSGTYSYFVHDFSNRGLNSSRHMSLSGAQVRVYQGSVLLECFNVPGNQEGTLWHVFDFDLQSKAITEVNTMSYESSSSGIGGSKGRGASEK